MSSASGTSAAQGRGSSGFQRLARLLENARYQDWWEFKIPPLLATAYATALLLQIPFAQLWPLLLLILFALLPGAVYVCVINDITDVEDDRLSGKSNRMADKSGAFKFIALLVSILPGLIACWLFRHYPLTLSFYFLNWMAYTFYSVPPFRCKVRGAWGVAMDAGGAHLLPTLWIASLVAEATGHAVPAFFLGALGVWALCIGLRGIFWHQLLDRENDLRSQISTLATQIDPLTLRRFVYFVTFPLELAALLLILVQVNTPWAWVMLAIYLTVEGLTDRCLGIDLILVQPSPRFRILFGEYYQLQYPLTFLLAMTQQSLEAVWLLLLQLALFPYCLLVFLRNVNYLLGHRLGNAIWRRLPFAHGNGAGK